MSTNPHVTSEEVIESITSLHDLEIELEKAINEKERFEMQIRDLKNKIAEKKLTIIDTCKCYTRRLKDEINLVFDKNGEYQFE